MSVWRVNPYPALRVRVRVTPGSKWTDPLQNPYPRWRVRVFSGTGPGTPGNTRGLPVPCTSCCFCCCCRRRCCCCCWCCCRRYFCCCCCCCRCWCQQKRERRWQGHSALYCEEMVDVERAWALFGNVRFEIQAESKMT